MQERRGAVGLNQLSGVVLVLVVAAITLGLGLTVLQSFSSATSGTAGSAVNATITAVGALGTTWFSIIVKQKMTIQNPLNCWKPLIVSETTT